MLTWNEWKLQSALSEEELEVLEDRLLDSDYEVDAVQMGFATEEERIKAYFDGGEPHYASLFKRDLLFVLYNEQTQDIWVDEKREDLAFALYQLENSLYPAIDEDINEFMSDLSRLNFSDFYRFSIEPQREFNGSLSISYQVSYDNCLIQDNIQILDANKTLEAIQQYEATCQHVQEAGYQLEGNRKAIPPPPSLRLEEGESSLKDVEKMHDAVGFNRSYVFRLRKDDEIIEATASLQRTIQGQARQTSPFLIDILDQLN